MGKEGMPGQDTRPQKYISRRTVVKGLALLALAVSDIGCASPGSSSNITPTPTKVLPPGSIIYTYHGHSDQVLAVAWSPGGGRIASGSRDMTIQVWDAFTGKHAFTYRGHSNAVASLAWSPDGRRIASASWDKTVQLWEASTGVHLYTY